MALELVKASQYSVEELTELYNHTRVDYMVPMPMNAARLAEYIHVYDVDLGQSLVAKEGKNVVGLGMLAVREGRSWITRLGLIAKNRGKGAGQALMEGLMDKSRELGIRKTMLEVIKGNEPAYHLFLKLGFTATGELLILRRAPKEVEKPTTRAHQMDRGEIIYHLNHRRRLSAWTNQTESLAQVKGVNGFKVYTEEGGQGWLVYQRTLFNLSRLTYGTSGGDPAAIMRELLNHLHSQYPEVDTYTENVPAEDPHLQAFEELGYIETFRRVHMLHRETP